jgi:hypothetical protein
MVGEAKIGNFLVAVKVFLETTPEGLPTLCDTLKQAGVPSGKGTKHRRRGDHES